jgi:23S rRNA (uracil1939-C5)-methyltransferase
MSTKRRFMFINGLLIAVGMVQAQNLSGAEADGRVPGFHEEFIREKGLPFWRGKGGYLQIRERTSVRIDDVAFGGDGVGRVDDFVLFVPLAVDEDELEVEITAVRKNFCKGRIIRIVTPSPYRVSPPCPYYGRCGGCSLQHISYPHQLSLKKHQIEEALRRIAGISAPPVAPVIPSPQPLGWRGKAEFHLAGGSRKTRNIGLMAAMSNQVIEVERCLIVEESINSKYKAFKENIRNGSVAVPLERQVVWADEPGEAPTAVFAGQGKPPDVIRIVKEKRITVPGRGFFQANIFLVEKLVEQVMAMAAISGGETVIDLYGGAGLFSLFLGEKAGRLFCGEGDEEAVRCAGINLNRLAEAKCCQGDAAAILLRELVIPGIKADVVVIDPPRDGCGGGVMDLLVSLQPQRIVYVSCNPATQARDIKRLAGSGYCLEIVQPLDMFPQTAHVEAVALLTR